MSQFNFFKTNSKIKKAGEIVLNSSLRFKISAILIIPIILYLAPYPVKFNGKVYADDLRWNSSLENEHLIIKYMELSELDIEGKNIKIKDNRKNIEGKLIREKLIFDKENKTYSIQDLKIDKNNSLRVRVYDGDDKNNLDSLSIEIEANGDKSAENISLKVVNNTSGLSPWQYQQGQNKIQVKGQNDISITATSIKLNANLIDNHRNDLFSIYNLPISPNSMRFESIIEQLGQPRKQSTIREGNISLFKHSEDVQLTEKGQYIKFDSPGISILNELSLSRCQNQEQNQTLCLLAKVAGKTQRIKIGQDLERPSKIYRSNILTTLIGSEPAKWLVGAIIGAFIVFLFNTLQESVKKQTKANEQDTNT